jgi:hypothetical protein
MSKKRFFSPLGAFTGDHGFRTRETRGNSGYSRLGKNLQTWVEKRRPKSKNTIPHWQRLWNRRTALCHPNRKGGKRMRSRIRSMSTSQQPLVTQPPDTITIQAVPNLTAQERKSTTKVRDHRRTRYKTRFCPLYAMAYHKAKRSS